MSIQSIIAGIIIAAALFFLARRYYKIFTGKKSGCNCGTNNFIIKNGILTENKCGCCKCKASPEK